MIVFLTKNDYCLSSLYLHHYFYFILQEEIVFEATSSAVENLKTYLAQNNIESAVRISMMQGG